MLPKTNMKACFRLLQLMSELELESLRVLVCLGLGLGLGLVTADAATTTTTNAETRNMLRRFPWQRLQLEFVFPTSCCAAELRFKIGYVY